MLVLRSLIFQIVFFLNMFALMIVWLPAMPMRRQINQELGRTWGRTTLWLLEKICGLKIEWRGLENIPEGAVIVASKHQSIWETFVLPIRFPDFSYILKHELIWLPFFGWYLLAAEQIAIDRAKGGKLMPQLVAKAKKIFAQGRQLFIFPEGTRRPAGAPPRYKFGIAHLYAGTDTPVLPVAVNSGLFWPRRAFVVRPGTAVIEFLPLIPPGMAPQEFFETLTTRIEDASNRLIEEAVAKDPSLAAVVEKGRARAAPAKEALES